MKMLSFRALQLNFSKVCFFLWHISAIEEGGLGRLQGTKVTNFACVPNVTLSVRFEHKYDDKRICTLSVTSVIINYVYIMFINQINFSKIKFSLSICMSL